MSEDRWEAPPEKPGLRDGIVHLWRIELGKALPSGFESGLSHDELERAGRFRSLGLRRRYIASSYALRDILARYVGIPMGKIPIRASAMGKPYLRAEDVGQEIFFSLSHTGERGMVAVARSRVGVDIEESVDDYPHIEVAKAHFADGEVTALQREMDPVKRAALFFRYWTRKEALLKASGEGMHGDLRGADFSSGMSRVSYIGSEWTVMELEPEGRLFCSLVVEGGLTGLEHYEWEPLKKG